MSRIRDSKAEALEARGLYRRASDRWREVLMLCTEDDDRKQAKQSIERCLRKTQRPPVVADSYAGVREAATKVQKEMGIDSPNGKAFRQHRVPESPRSGVSD